MGDINVTSDHGLSRDLLIGESPTISVELDNVAFPFLLDTGSQVTMLRESAFNEGFGYQGARLQDPSAWLTLRAANGLSIPYLGYVEMDVRLGDVHLPRCGIIIVKDDCLVCLDF